ncbi:S26 family signal peptidase [Pelagibius sp.]|uniref:S26 family signal peptidase n=1 Tax=Pelagibius sp. TaxID=1931238 RepID=UPI003BAC85ED
MAVASLVILPKKLIYNASASAPIGLYWLDNRPIKRGDYVLMRVPERVRLLVIERGYLPPDVPLLKRVVGLNGDRICRQLDEISVNGSPVATANRWDGLGRDMLDWHGCHVLTEQTVFLLQDHRHSFDSRYFGPVDRRLITGRATRLRVPWQKD